MSSLTLDHVSASLNGTRIVTDISLNVASGTFLGLIGPNGAGKTTLVRAIAGVLPSTGAIRIADTLAGDLDASERAKRIAYLAQSAECAWPMTAARLVALGRLPHQGPMTRLTPENRKAIDRAMARAGVAAFADRPVNSLSGGERARVLLARALAVEADILLVDEPVASLDPYHQLNIMDVLKAEAARGVTVIAVLHDLSLAARYCSELVLMNNGSIVATGRPDTVLTTELLSSVYRVEAHAGSREGEPYIVPWRRMPG